LRCPPLPGEEQAQVGKDQERFDREGRPAGRQRKVRIRQHPDRQGDLPHSEERYCKKMEPYAGSRAELEAMPKEVDGKKVYEVWTFSRTIEGQKPRRLPSE